MSSHRRLPHDIGERDGHAEQQVGQLYHQQNQPMASADAENLALGAPAGAWRGMRVGRCRIAHWVLHVPWCVSAVCRRLYQRWRGMENGDHIGWWRGDTG